MCGRYNGSEYAVINRAVHLGGRPRNQFAPRADTPLPGCRALGWLIVFSCVLVFDIRPAFADTLVFLVFLIRPYVAWWAAILGAIFEGYCVWRFLGLN